MCKGEATVANPRRRVEWDQKVKISSSGFNFADGGRTVYYQQSNYAGILRTCFGLQLIQFPMRKLSQTWFWEFFISSFSRQGFFSIGLYLDHLDSPLSWALNNSGALLSGDIRTTIHHRGSRSLNEGDVLGMFVEKQKGDKSATVTYLINGQRLGSGYAFTNIPSNVVPACSFTDFTSIKVTMRFYGEYIPPGITRVDTSQ
jgi:hypothetical protein